VSKALEANEPRVVQMVQPTSLQHPGRAPVIHQQQVQLHPAAAAAAAGQTATLQHMNQPGCS